MLFYFIDDTRLTLFMYITTFLIFANAYVISKCNEVKEKIDVDNEIMRRVNDITTKYGTDELVRACGGDIDLMFTIVTLPMLAINRLVRYNKLLVIRRATLVGSVVFFATNFILGLILL